MVGCGGGVQLGMSGSFVGGAIWIGLNNAPIFWFGEFHWWLSHRGCGFGGLTHRGNSLYRHHLVMSDGFLIHL